MPNNMVKLLLVVFAVNVALVITGVMDVPGTSLFTFLTNPTDWENTDFLGVISGVFLTVGVGALIVAGTVITRSDIFLFSGIALVFLSFGLPLAETFSIISAQINPIIAWVIVSPIILMYVVICVAWWRNRA